MRLSVGRLLDEAGLEDVRRDEGLYVALWRGGADAWRREQAVRPLTPQALGSHALLVAVHPEGAEVVFGADRLLLTGDGAVLVPTSSSYRLESRGSDLKLLVVVGTRLDESAAPQGSEHAVLVGGDEEAGRDGDEVGQEQPTGEEQRQDQPEVAGEDVDVQAIVAAALAKFTDGVGPPPTMDALEEEDQHRRSEEAQVAMERNEEPEFKGEEAQSAVEQDEGLEIVGAKEAREVGPRELGVADRAGPKTGEVESCRHWAKGWCMRVDACRFAHPQPPVPRGVPQELLLILPPAPAVFVEVTRPPAIQGQDVWPIAPSNMWQARHAAVMCRALQGHAAALPRAPAAQSSSNRPAACWHCCIACRGRGARLWRRWSPTPRRCACTIAERAWCSRSAPPTWRPCTLVH